MDAHQVEFLAYRLRHPAVGFAAQHAHEEVLEEGRLTGDERCRHGHASGGGREAVLARCAGAGAAKQY